MSFPNLNRDYFAIIIRGNTGHFIQWHGAHRRAYPTLMGSTVRWCEENIGYTPLIKHYPDRPKNQLWIRFANSDDAVMFKLKFGA